MKDLEKGKKKAMMDSTNAAPTRSPNLLEGKNETGTGSTMMMNSGVLNGPKALLGGRNASTTVRSPTAGPRPDPATHQLHSPENGETDPTVKKQQTSMTTAPVHIGIPRAINADESLRTSGTSSTQPTTAQYKIPRHPQVEAAPATTRSTRERTRVTVTMEQEQAIFEQRLCEDAYGVAVRKINQNGKSNLRYVKCVTMDDDQAIYARSSRSISSRSAGSWGRRSTHSRTQQSQSGRSSEPKSRRVLIWGKKKDVQITLDKFVSVRKGKTTARARRNPAPADRILSLITTDNRHPSLDIEAPTALDRDKFARAFAKFLEVPLEGDDARTVHSADVQANLNPEDTKWSTSNSAPGDVVNENVNIRAQASSRGAGAYPPPLPPGGLSRNTSDSRLPPESMHSSQPSSTQRDSDISNSNRGAEDAMVAMVHGDNEEPKEEEDDDSGVSSLTGHGYDQELVEELHHALNELRAELEESRAEAARAVKVAEQAIQSAEKNNSAEWQNTVTHKAAEAAAMAQKRSAEAMAKQRLAEERLDGERRKASFWRKQAEIAEEEAGVLQTRAAAAEVQRASMEEQLESERILARAMLDTLKGRIATCEVSHEEALDAALERNRLLELELESTRREIESKVSIHEISESMVESQKNGTRKKIAFGRKKRNSHSESMDSKALLSSDSVSSSATAQTSSSLLIDSHTAEQLLRLHAECVQMRQQLELLKRVTSDELQQLPADSKAWISMVGEALQASQSEVVRLRDRLGMESASRRKLLHEVQDLRGVVRVYCRPRAQFKSTDSADQLLSMPSRETIYLQGDQVSPEFQHTGRMAFDFDRVFDPDCPQQEVYSEIEEVCLGTLDGYRICIIAYGQTGCGKTRTLLGDIELTEDSVEIRNQGIQLQTMRQMFAVAEQRNERYKDAFSFSIVEVYNERLCDLLGGTPTADCRGKILSTESKSSVKKKSPKTPEDDISSSKTAKLELKTDIHGETIVQGLIWVEVESFDDVYRIWQECLETRAMRLAEQDIDIQQYEASSHVIATLKVDSKNIATGIATSGRIQFVDMAGSDLIPTRPAASEKPDSPESKRLPEQGWGFANRSLETLHEVISARSQFERTVPYRNSTITHLLRDSLEADTKVLLIACVSCDPRDFQETSSTLRFASQMRRVAVGKATRHIVSGK